MPACDWFRQIIRQTAILEIVADQHGAGERQYDHHNISLEPDEIAEGLGRAVEVQPVQEFGEFADFDRDAAEGDRLLCGLLLNPDDQILTVKEKKENHQRQRVEAPE